MKKMLREAEKKTLMEVEKPKEEEEEQRSSLIGVSNKGNGLDFEKYSWTQNLQEVTVTIPVPSGTKALSVTCEIKKNSLRVGLQGKASIIDGQFFNAVKPDDCLWVIEDQKVISVFLTKQDQMEWWRYCLKGEPEIDTPRVEPESCKLSDLDPETRTRVRKQMGLPTNDAMEKQYMVLSVLVDRVLWDLEGVKCSSSFDPLRCGAAIKLALKSLGFVGVMNIKAYAAAGSFSKNILKRLRAGGVDVKEIIVPPGMVKKGSQLADDAIKLEDDDPDCRPGALAVLIACDGGYKEMVKKWRAGGMKTLLNSEPALG